METVNATHIARAVLASDAAPLTFTRANVRKSIDFTQAVVQKVAFAALGRDGIEVDLGNGYVLRCAVAEKRK